MKITGVIVNLLVNIAPDVYGPYVVYENGKKVIYVQVLRALYGMLVSALLWYRKFRSDLEEIGFDFNFYDSCVANRIVNGKQQTVRFHVNDLMSSHVDKRVNDKFAAWLEKKYGEHGPVKTKRGKVHDYLGIRFDFSKKGKVIVDMCDYMKKICTDFKEKYVIEGTAPTPATNDLFKKGDGPKLDAEMKEDFHTFVARGLFACNRGRPDTNPTIAVLATRVRDPNTDDWKKLVRYIKFVDRTKNDVLTLSAESLHILKWHIDVSFGVHPDFKSHTGATMTMGTGAIQSGSMKQRLNTRNTCESELVGCDDMSVKVLWTRLFVEAQGYKVERNIIYQDNKSTILLLENGKRSAGKRSRAINLRYYFMSDQKEKGNLEVEYCPTKDMTGDYMTKPKQGKEFKKFRGEIMGFE